MPRVHKDGVTGYKYDYSYDSIGRLIRTDISNSSDSSYVGSTEYGYDVRNNLTSIVNDIGGNSYKQIYGYYNTGVGNAAEDTKDNLPIRYALLDINTDYSYNSLNQLTARTVDTTSNDLTNQYFYNTTTKNSATYYTNQLKCEVIEGVSYHFAYDKVGNITSIGKGKGATSTASNYKEYTYDAINRLLSETRYDEDTKSTYTYNHLGNITSIINTNADGTTTKSKISYTYTTDSDAGWNYLLTKLTFTDYTNNTTTTESIDYDAIGNPISYRGASMAWRGRQLTGFTKNGITSTMTYDADGLRSSKTVAGVKTTYQYVGDKLFYENRGNGDSFYYFYDSYGKLSAIYHHRNGTKVAYHVVTNSQGDVISLYDWAGYLVAYYEYDAWGNCTITQDTSATGIATLNPFRYRGYYYDTDLGLYYLQSRYYDSEIGRFINADNQISGVGGDIQGYNMYSYCMNNPINMTDGSGNWPSWATKLVAAVAVVAVVAAVAAVTVATAGAGTAIAAVAVGAAKGAAIGFAVGAASGAAIGYATTGTLEGTLNGMANGALSGSISGAITGGVQGYSNYSNYTSARNFLKNNGQNPDEILSCFKGAPKVKTLKADTTVYRTWGGTTQELGHWVSPNNYGSSAQNLLSLPAGNTMTNTSSFLLPKGTTVLAGKAAPLFGQSGGGVQWWISVLG